MSPVLPPSSHFSQIQETQSLSNQSFGSDFHSYGLIKVSDGQLDDCDSQDSFLSLHIGGKTDDPKRKKQALDQTISFCSSNGTASRTDVNGNKVDTNKGVQNTVYKTQETLPREVFASDFAPSPGIDQSEEVLKRVIESYHSETGAFLTKSIFLSNKIYSNQDTVANGSVKINLIQEVNELLRKFLPDSKGTLNLPTLTSVRTTIEYYEKLTNAFDVLNKKVPEEDTFEDFDSNESSYGMNSSRNSLYETQSIDSGASRTSRTSKSPQASIPDPLNKTTRENRRKRSDSMIFDKFRFKKRSSKQLNNQSNGTDSLLRRSVSNSQHLHSRAVSISTIASQNSSSARSVRDQASIQDYFQALDYLHKTMVEIHDLYMGSNDVDVCNRLNLVIEYHSEYILKFLLQDISTLLMKHIKKYAQEMV